MQAKEAREELKKAQAAVKQLEKEKRLAQSALVNQEHDTEREVRMLDGGDCLPAYTHPTDRSD